MIKRSKTDNRNFQDIKPLAIPIKKEPDNLNKKWKKTDKWEAMW